MLSIVLAASLAVSAKPAPMLGFFDGEGLVATCAASGAVAAAKHAVCLGYVSGAVDMALAHQALTPSERRTVCPPPGLKLDAAVQAVLIRASWATRARGLGAASFVKLALEDAYPCRSDQDIM